MSLCVITTFFNPFGFKTPISNYHIFADSLRSQGANLLTVELAFGDKQFCLSGPGIYRLRGNSVMWQKERLLNHALTLLPDDCDMVVWADADILWPDASWLERTRQSLGKCDVAQVFEGAIRLPPGLKNWSCRNSDDTPLTWEPGTSFHLLNGRQFNYTVMGYAWAGRRDWLTRVGFYEKCVLGSGDYVMLNALFKLEHGFGYAPLDEDVAGWQRGVNATQPRIGYVPGTICHLYHGSNDLRRYGNRHLILAAGGFDPKTDVKVENNVLTWASHKPSLHAAVNEYFSSRCSDD